MGLFEFLDPRNGTRSTDPRTKVNEEATPPTPNPSDNSEELDRLIAELIPTQDAMIAMQRQLLAQKRIMASAIEMHAQGPEGNTPLAKLLTEGVVEGTTLSIMTSAHLTDWDKLQMIMALTISAMREYEITLY